MARRVRRVEWQTVTLAVTIYGLWLSLTWFHASIPWPLLLIGGGWTIAWYGSLQHELIHGHPTRFSALNRAIGLPPLALFLPFDRYRALHLAHHRNDHLTDPREDPESQYWNQAGWLELNPFGRSIVTASASLPGRLTIGPLWMIARFLLTETRRLRTDERGVRAAWARHLPMLALVLAWVVVVCGMNPLTYCLCFVLPGSSLLMLRSFAEHRAAFNADHRTAVVEHARVLGWLFLFNNLHSAHHERPSLAWYRLPGWYHQERERLLQKNGGLAYRSYADVLWRFLLRPHDQPVHPFDAALSPPPR